MPRPHTCHARGCEVLVPPRMLMCKDHWFQVPRRLRTALWGAYRYGQEIDKDPSEEYLRLAGECINAVAGLERRSS